MLRGRRLRRRDLVTTDAEDDVEEDRLELDVHARAHLEIAFSTPAEIAPRGPPKELELELEEEDDDDDTECAGDGERGGGEGGGDPR